MRTLLGHLAQFASFHSQGELLCTQGLAYLLEGTTAICVTGQEPGCEAECAWSWLT